MKNGSAITKANS